MKDTIVIYKSKYGATKQYATWLGEEVGAVVKPLSKVKKSELEKYETIIYGGGIYGGRITGIGKIRRYLKKTNNKRIIVFGVAVSPISRESLNIEKKNIKGSLADRVTYFHLRGRMDYSRLKFTHSLMMKGMKKYLESKTKPLSSGEKGLLDNYGKTVDYIDKRSIQPILKVLKKKY